MYIKICLQAAIQLYRCTYEFAYKLQMTFYHYLLLTFLLPGLSPISISKMFVNKMFSVRVFCYDHD